MVKNTALTLIACFFSLNSYSETLIRVDISEQRLYLIKNQQILVSYPISSSSYGEGQTENSYKTPLGMHKIKEMIGSNAPKDTIFISRINTKRTAKIIKLPNDTKDDFVHPGLCG